MKRKTKIKSWVHVPIGFWASYLLIVAQEGQGYSSHESLGKYDHWKTRLKFVYTNWNYNEFQVAFPCAIILAIALAHPTKFPRKHLNATSDDYGWYSPVAMLLSPLPMDSGSVNRNRLKVNGYRGPLEFSPSQWSPDPWYHPPLRYHYGINKTNINI